MTRRETLLALLALGIAPLGAFAQPPPKNKRIGFLQVFPSANDPRFELFKQQLRDLGYAEGKTIAIDYLSAEAKYDRLPALAAELVRRKVDIILADGGTPSAVAAKNATRTIPIVFVGVADPVGQGIVASLARPGGNVTGMSSQQLETGVKSLALLKEILPSARHVAVLTNPTNASLAAVVSKIEAGAKTLRLEITVVNASAPAEFDGVFMEIARIRPAGVAILGDTMFNDEAERLAKLAAKHRLPTIGGHIALPEHGGLMSYGSDRLELLRRATVLVDKILKGAKPGDLPIEQPTKFELVVNLNTAKALGLTIPKSILIGADRTIR